MMNYNKTLLWVAIGGVAAYFGIKWAMGFHVTAKEKAILELEASKYKTFDVKFLKEWADAKRFGLETFVFDDKLYLTSTGRVKK
jgi:ABC-type bacteriocin/lantibiotic exporter with double-glycine peptidase domain